MEWIPSNMKIESKAVKSVFFLQRYRDPEDLGCQKQIKHIIVLFLFAFDSLHQQRFMIIFIVSICIYEAKVKTKIFQL